MWRGLPASKPWKTSVFTPGKKCGTALLEVSTAMRRELAHRSVEGSRRLAGLQFFAARAVEEPRGLVPARADRGLQRTQDGERIALRAVQKIVLARVDRWRLISRIDARISRPQQLSRRSSREAGFRFIS